ncbi:MAG: single-stranded-DNA-specific exonuclease RecJ [Brevefilum sp.]|nr:single-stranded-DNA-specific exonuclease RecJ [Brevefilum sp.]
MGVEKRWVTHEQIIPPPAFQAAIGGHPLVAQTLYQRGCRTIESAQAFLNPDKYQPAPPTDLPDLAAACELLATAIHTGQNILVWGDFDVDGQTATTLLVEGLRQVGGKVSYHIPVRAEESHGITRQALKAQLEIGFDLLLTCDTGITEFDNLQMVRNLNIPVIVTDHHTLGERLPPANAVINPQRLPADHPLRTLPGVGVAYQLIEGLYAHLACGLNTGNLLELVALGIVADVADLQGDTRYLLQRGLLNLRQTQRIGLQMLYEKAELNPANLNEGHIGFQIGPRLNAVGRLADANPMIDFLTTTDPARARTLLYQIEGLNTNRRFATRQVEQGAERQLSTSAEDRHAPAIILHQPTWPGGVVGIVASRLVERYHKPVILLTGDDPIHGSARSIPGLHITEAIAAQADLLDGFGGHPMAAGLSLPAQNYPAFKRRMLATIQAQIGDVERIQEIPVAQELTLDQVNLDLVAEIERLAPFGPGNPPLVFLLRDLKWVSESAVGANQEHRQVTVQDERENKLPLIWWNGADEPLPAAQFDLLCKLTRSDYKGSPQLSAEWVDYRLSQAGRQAVEARQIDIIDYRDLIDPQAQLARCLAVEPEGSVWGEGQLPENLPFKGRHELEPTPHLVIWTAPPSQSVLHQVIGQTQPKTVTVFGVDPQLDDQNRFLSRLGGIAKYAITHMNGQASLERLAAACASQPETVGIGLQLWGARGEFAVEVEGETVYLTAGGTEPDSTAAEYYEAILKSLLLETRAFRSYFKRADLQTLLMT